MIAAGAQLPDVTVWRGPREPVALADLVRERRALFVFYLFDWSST